MQLRLWLLVVLTLAGAFTPSRACALGAENRTWDFFPQLTETRHQTESQVADPHQGSLVFASEIASGNPKPQRAQRLPMITVPRLWMDVAPYVGQPGFNMFRGERIAQTELDTQNSLWLNQAIQRGDDIWLVTDPAAHAELMNSLLGNPRSAYLNLELPMLNQYSGVSPIPVYAPH